MVLVYTIWSSGVPDIEDLSPEIILDIAFWVKSKMAAICAKLSYKLINRHNRHKFVILVCTIGVSGMPDIVVGLKNIVDIALWVKSKMAVICSN